jgi:excisionase family DNA binding protein
MGEYMNVDEAAGLIGRTAHAMYRLVARCQIPFRTYGRRLVFKRSELLEFLERLPGLTIEEFAHREDR